MASIQVICSKALISQTFYKLTDCSLKFANNLDKIEKKINLHTQKKHFPKYSLIRIWSNTVLTI